MAVLAVESTPPAFFFFFQAEDGIRDLIVTGVQTCALPISNVAKAVGLLGFIVSGNSASCTGQLLPMPPPSSASTIPMAHTSESASGRPRATEIGRASCRERV